MNIKILIVTLSFGLNSICHSQVDSDLLDIEASWFNIQEDLSLPLLQDTFSNLNSQITGFECTPQSYLRKDNKLFELFTTGSNIGSYLTCTDTQTGELIWTNSFNLLSDDKIEIDLNIFNISESLIGVSGMRLLSESIPNFFPFGLVVRKNIDINNGQLVSRIYQEFTDGGCICNNTNGQLGRTLPIIDDSLYLTVCTYPSNDGELIQIMMTTDNDGFVQDTLAYITNPLMNNDIQSHKLIDVFKLNDNKFLIASTSTSNPTDSTATFAELFFINNTGELLIRKNISSELNYSSFFHPEVKSENIFITSTSFNFQTPDPLDVSHNLLILDSEGLEIFRNSSYTMLDGEEVGSLRLTEVDSMNYILLGADKNCLKYFTLSEGESIKHIKTICYADTTYNLVPNFIDLSEDQLIQGVRWIQNDTKSFQITFAFNKNELESANSIHNENLAKEKQFTISPNPASEFTVAKFNERISGIVKVYNLNGELVKEWILNSQDELQIDISLLQNGYYILKIENDKIAMQKYFIKND